MENLEVYCVLPPVYAGPLTMEKSYITQPSLLGAFDIVRHGRCEPYNREMPGYRWTT